MKSFIESQINQTTSIQNVVIMAGPGGKAFSNVHVENLKKALVAHDKNVEIIGDGVRNLNSQDVDTVTQALNTSNKKTLLVIFCHGITKNNQHYLVFSDELDYPSKELLDKIFSNPAKDKIDFLILSCYGEMFLKELQTKKENTDYAICLSPRNEVVSGMVVDKFVRNLFEIGGVNKFLLTQDLLPIYLGNLTAKISPCVLNKNNEIINLESYSVIEETIYVQASKFFPQIKINDNRSTLSSTNKDIDIEHYPCWLFLNALQNKAVIISESSFLYHFDLSKKRSYFTEYKDQSMDFLSNNDVKPVLKYGEIPSENKENEFSNYKEKNANKYILETTINFSKGLLSKDRKENLMLVLTGAAGMGKTHLGISTLNTARKQGLNAYYISFDWFKSIKQNELYSLQNTISANPGIILIDDCNNSYDSSVSDFIKFAFFSTKNSIMITSNESLVNLISELPFGENVGICNEVALSERRPWWNEINLESPKLPTNKCCALLLQREQIDLNQIKEEINNIRFKLSLPEAKIRIAGSPFVNGRYVNSEIHFKFNPSDNIDLFIIKVTNNNECDQLLNIIGSAFEHNKKLIIVSEDEKKFFELLEKRLYFATDKVKIKARLDNVLLTSLCYLEINKAPIELFAELELDRAPSITSQNISKVYSSDINPTLFKKNVNNTETVAEFFENDNLFALTVGNKRYFCKSDGQMYKTVNFNGENPQFNVEMNSEEIKEFQSAIENYKNKSLSGSVASCTLI